MDGWYKPWLHLLCHISSVVHFSPSDSPDTKQSQYCLFKFKVIYSMLHCWSIHLSITPPPPPPQLSLSPWLQALIPWWNQRYRLLQPCRMHSILHYNHTNIDLHLLNIMFIANMDSADKIWLPRAGPLPLIKAICMSTIASKAVYHGPHWNLSLEPLRRHHSLRKY